VTETVEVPVAARAALPETPYVGLIPFAEADAPFFFGRERQRRLIAANLVASRLTLLYGASGVGKSSVLRAGVAHDFMQLARRERANGRAPEAILVVFAEWRDPPLPLLAKAIEEAVRSTLGELAPAPPPPTEHFDDLLAEWVKRIDAVQAGGDGERRARLLVVLDQFEEYFLYQWRSDEDKGGLGVEFPRAVNREGLRANFAISIREDAYAQLDRFKGSIPNLFESYLRIRHLDHDAARRAIRLPVLETWNGRLPEGATPYTIEDELVEEVLKEVRIGSFVLGQSGGGSVGELAERRVEAPFLQLVMRRLWRETVEEGEHALTLARLDALGGAEAIVRAHLKDALDELEPRQRDLAARMFNQLVTPEGTKIAHTVGALSSYAEVAPDELLPMLTTLSDGRILRPVDPPSGQTTPRYEIYHDVLAAPILEWCAEHVREKRERLRLDEELRRQQVRRARLVTAGLAVGLVIALALSALALVQRNNAIEQSELARSQELANTARAQIRVDPELAVLLALEAVKASPTEQAQDALRASLAASHVRIVLPHRGPVVDASYSSDGSNVLTAASDGNARLWNATTGRRLRLFRARGGMPEAAIDVSGTRVAAAAGKGGQRLWDARTGRSIDLPGGRLVAASVAFSPDGRLVAAAGRNPGRSFEVRVWRAADGVPVQIFRGHTRFIYHVEFSPDGRRLVSASKDRTARIWTLGRPDAVVIRHELSVNDARFSPDGSFVATAGWDGIVRVVGVTGEPRRDLRVGRGRLYSVAFGPRAGILAAASADWTVQYWDAGRTSVLRGHTGAVSHVAFSSRGDLLSASADGTARVWDVSAGEARTVLRGHAGPVASAAFSPDGRRVVTTSSDRTARIWDVAREPLLADLHPAGPGGRPSFSTSGYGVRFSDDGRFLLVRSGFDRPRLYDASGTLQAALPRRGGTTTSGAFNPDGTLVATATAAGPVQIWEVPGGRLVRSLRGHTPRPVVPGGVPYIVRRVEFSPDGSTLLTAGYDGTARIWDVSTWRTLLVLGAPGARGFLEAATFSGDGKLVATAGFGNQPVRIWDAGDGRLVRTLPARSVLHCASFGRDSTVLASCGADGVARLWDVASGRLLLALRGHADAVLSAVFSPDGELVATTGQDRTARIWDTASGAPVAVVSDVGGYPAVFAADGSLVAAGGSIVLARTGDQIADVGRVGEPLVSAVSPDGRLAATIGYGGQGGLVRCSLCEPLPELVALARLRLTRALTPQERARFVS